MKNLSLYAVLSVKSSSISHLAWISHLQGLISIVFPPAVLLFCFSIRVVILEAGLASLPTPFVICGVIVRFQQSPGSCWVPLLGGRVPVEARSRPWTSIQMYQGLDPAGNFWFHPRLLGFKQNCRSVCLPSFYVWAFFLKYIPANCPHFSWNEREAVTIFQLHLVHISKWKDISSCQASKSLPFFPSLPEKNTRNKSPSWD